MNAENRVIVTVNPKTKTALGWLLKSKTVCSVANETENAPTFSSISSLLTQLVTDTQTLDGLQAKTPKGAPDNTAARNAQWRVLQKSFRAFARGVQGLCDAAADANHAKAIVAQAGLDYRIVPVRVTPPLRGKALGNGAVKLFARRPVPRRSGAFFEWQMSSDGKSWSPIATTNTATTTVQGLTPATTVYFRCRSTYKNVTSSWSEANVIVH